MNQNKPYRRILHLLLATGVFWCCLALDSAYAQNTKGDKPAPSRDSRFQRSGARKAVKPARNRRIKFEPSGASTGKYKPRENRRSSEASGRALGRTFTSRPNESGLAQRGGNQRRVTPRSSSARVSSRNVYPQRGPYVNNPSRKPDRRKPQIVNNTATIRRLKKLQGDPDKRPTKLYQPQKPLTATRAYRRSKSINVFATFKRPKRKGEQATLKDIAGRNLRARNYSTPARPVLNPTFNPYAFRKRGGRNAGRTAGGYRASGQNGERAWIGDIAGRKLRTTGKPGTIAAGKRIGPGIKTSGRRRVSNTGLPRSAPGRGTALGATFRGKQMSAGNPRNRVRSRGGLWNNGNTALEVRNAGKTGLISAFSGSQRRLRPLKGGGSVSGRLWNNRNSAIPVRNSGRNGRISAFSGNQKGARPLKGGGSVSGNLWNNRNSAIPVRNSGRNGRISAFSGNQKGSRPLKGGGSVSGKLWNNRNSAIPVRNSGRNGRLSAFAGNQKGSRPLKGGGSVSGKLWNNKNSAIPVRNSGRNGRLSAFAGNIKGSRPLKGGGSVSGKLWNNKNSAIPVRNSGRNGRLSAYAGNLKGSRPLKGGGSVSGRLWNNREQAVTGKAPSRASTAASGFPGRFRRFQISPGFQDQGEQFTGTKKIPRRPLKGGGSVSGKLWNNREQAVTGKAPSRASTAASGFPGRFKLFQLSPGFQDQGEEFTGTKRIPRKPLKGGGSVSGKLWNNREQAVTGKAPSRSSTAASGFPGRYKRFQLSPGFQDQGEEFTGTRKAKKPVKGGGSISGKLWNNKETAITPRQPSSAARAQASYQGNKRRLELTPGFQDQGEEFTGTKRLSRLSKPYIKNENAPDNQLLKRRPDETTWLVDRQYNVVRVRKRVANKNANELALLKYEPTAATKAVDGLQIKVKQYHYRHNPSSSEEALKVREPGKAFARATDYQGNIRMIKFKIFDQQRQVLYPDTRFLKLNKNNVDGEKSLLTSVKLWWSKTFKKQESQPNNLKKKETKPRYDKGEIGMWYD